MKTTEGELITLSKAESMRTILVDFNIKLQL